MELVFKARHRNTTSYLSSYLDLQAKYDNITDRYANYKVQTGLTSGHGTVFCHNNITRLQFAAIFVGQKKNEINRVTLISQHSDEVFENEKQLVNIDFKHIFGFSH